LFRLSLFLAISLGLLSLSWRTSGPPFRRVVLEDALLFGYRGTTATSRFCSSNLLSSFPRCYATTQLLRFYNLMMNSFLPFLFLQHNICLKLPGDRLLFAVLGCCLIIFMVGLLGGVVIMVGGLLVWRYYGVGCYWWVGFCSGGFG